MKIITKLLFGVFAYFVCGHVQAESIFIVTIPSKLPNGIGFGSYSPPVGISYSGLQSRYSSRAA